MLSTQKRKRSGFRAALRRLSIEALEGRAMLAGNVAVSVSSGNLFIRGDNAGNGVYVEQVGSGKYSVTGFTWDGGATKITARRMPQLFTAA